MDKKRCARCGKIYPSSYRTCPNCSGTGRGRRAAAGSPLEQVLTVLQQNKDRIFVICTAVFLLIAVLGIILTRLSSQEPNPAEDVPPPEQGDDVQEPEPEQKIMMLSADALSIYEGETAELTVTGTEDTPVWTSSDETVASVDGGVVTAKAAGTAVISAVCGLDKAACTVTVNVKGPDVEVYLNRTDFTLRSGDPPFQMLVKVRDTRANYQGTVVWSVEDTSVATISETGLVERVGRGTTTIFATMGGKVLECIVRVT